MDREEWSKLVDKCAECGKITSKNEKCEFCGKTYCETHMPQHMAWERRHENLAEDASRLWKRKRQE